MFRELTKRNSDEARCTLSRWTENTMNEHMKRGIRFLKLVFGETYFKKII